MASACLLARSADEMSFFASDMMLDEGAVSPFVLRRLRNDDALGQAVVFTPRIIIIRRGSSTVISS